MDDGRTGARILLERRGEIVLATLDGGDGRNLLTDDSLREIEAFARAIAEDADVRAVVLAGAGRNFCLGLDLLDRRATIAADPPLVSLRRTTDLGARAMAALQAIPCVTVAAIRGAAAGGGAALATACDFRVAADDARMGYPEIARGFNLMWGALPLCVRLVGPARAKRMILSGALEPADRLLAWGLVDEVAAPEGVLEAALAMAAAYAALPPVQVQMAKRSIDAVAGALDGAIMHMQADQFLLAARSEDCREAIDAFLQKRPPRYGGR